MIQVTFQRVDIEYHSTCNYDYVMARDGDGTVLMKKTCGSRKAPPAPFTSQTNKVQIIFHSDPYINRKGFQLSWKAVDPSAQTTVFSKGKGVWTSQNFPSNYPKDLETSKTLSVSPGSVLKVEFVSFDLEAAWVNGLGGRKCMDYLSAKDGDGTVLMKNSCGSSPPKSFTSKTNKVVFTFVTNYVNQKPGFKLSWRAIREKKKNIRMG